MEISWLGHSCFRLKGKAGTVITDPFNGGVEYELGKISANIVTLSHDHPGHNNSGGVGGDFKIIAGPGEYEIAGIFIYGVRTYHDKEKGGERGKNISFLIDIDDVKVCHLGDLGHVPSAGQIEDISDADVLLIPVGGVSTIDSSEAVQIISLISPTFVIPMHYKTEAVSRQLDPLDKFLKEMGIKEVTPVPKLTVNKSTMPIDMQTVVLDYKQS